MCKLAECAKPEDNEVLFEFARWKLSVAECFILLWLDDKGRLAERQSNGFLRTLALGASITDLVLLGFVDLDWALGPTWISDRLELRRLSVTDKARTQKLPDHVAWLQPLLAHIAETPGATLKSVARSYQCYTRVWSLLNDDASYDLRPHSNTTTDAITDSLVAKGIVRKEPAWNGVRFPEEDFACKDALIVHLWQAVLENDTTTLPSPASLALLAFAHRGGEEAGLMHGPFLGCSTRGLSPAWLNPWAQYSRSVFAPHEMKEAEKRMDELLSLGCGGAKLRPAWVCNEGGKG